MKIKRLGVLAAMAIAILGAIVPVRFANANYMNHFPPQNCPYYNSTEHQPYVGGTDYCNYGALQYVFPDSGNEQIFVIGTDFSVWTRWEVSGFFGRSLSDWQDLRGTIIHASPSDYNPHNFCGTASPHGTLTLWVKGTDRNWWKSTRDVATGAWTSLDTGWAKTSYSNPCAGDFIAGF
jgi:hypothetical protein